MRNERYGVAKLEAELDLPGNVVGIWAIAHNFFASNFSLCVAIGDRAPVEGRGQY